jgi:predicted enzyme related to lactoylglutathione lyase
MRIQTTLFVDDVEVSSNWYQTLLGLRSGHGGKEFEMLMDEDTIVLQLHRMEADEHPGIGLNTDAPAGNRVVIYYQSDDVLDSHERAKSMGADVVAAPHWNEVAGHTVFTARDPDGFVVSVYQRGQQV